MLRSVNFPRWWCLLGRSSLRRWRCTHSTDATDAKKWNPFYFWRTMDNKRNFLMNGIGQINRKHFWLDHVSIFFTPLLKKIFSSESLLFLTILKETLFSISPWVSFNFGWVITRPQFFLLLEKIIVINFWGGWDDFKNPYSGFNHESRKKRTFFLS